MHINVTFGSSAEGAPADFKKAVLAAVRVFETLISTDITVNICFGYGEVAGQALAPGQLGQSVSSGIELGYGDARNALAMAATSADDVASLAALTALDPTDGGRFFVSAAQAKALGLVDPQGGELDGYIGLSSTDAFSFDPKHRAVDGKYDAIGVLEREISEVLGRSETLGQPDSNGDGVYTLMDLFRFSAPGVHELGAKPAFFSINGKSMLQALNDPTQGDPGDWIGAVAGDAFSASPAVGTQNDITGLDERVLDVLGYDLAVSAPKISTPHTKPITETIEVSDSYEVQAGEQLYFQGAQTGQAFELRADSPTAAVSLTIAGSVTNFGHFPYGATGVVVTGNADASKTVAIEKTGRLLMQNMNDAWGVFVSSPTVVHNDGLIEAISGYENFPALGTSAIGVNGIDTFDYNGSKHSRIIAWAHAQGQAYGIYAPSGVHFYNAGVIEATSEASTNPVGAAVGVYSAFGDFVNKGLIRATALSGGSTGIAFGAGHILNKGTVIADYAMYAQDNAGSAGSITNKGVLAGAVVLSNYGGTIHNTGVIAGNIYSGDGDTLYDGTKGTLFGGVYFGHAANEARLGDGGATVVGGGGSDTVAGGAGADFIEIARGANSIDGAGGSNTLSFADSASGWTVDMAAGVATGAGATYFQNIQTVVGGSFDDLIQAGPVSATLIGWGGYDTLVGGGGNDTLISGTGGDLMTGGDGSDAFVYLADSHSVTVTDFDPGQGEVLQVFGYSGALSVSQSGADTLIRLSNTDSILIQDFSAGNLSPAALSFSEGPGPILPPSTPIFGSSTFYLSSDLAIYASEHIEMFDQFMGFFDLYLDSASSFFSFDNFGAVHLVDPQQAIGFRCDTAGAGLGETFTNEAGASFSVQSLTDQAIGFYAPTHALDWINAGQFTVQADHEARGIWTWESVQTIANAATGRLQVSSANSFARAIDLPNGEVIRNDGLITVTGSSVSFADLEKYAFAPVTAAIYTPALTLKPLINTGRIFATSTNGAEAYGLYIAGNEAGSTFTSITNSGLIKADVAIASFQNGNSGGTFLSLDIINSGVIQGDIDIMGGPLRIENSGRIIGDVHMGPGDGLYDGTGGLQRGVIDAGAGQDIVIGTAGGDSILGGGGDDLITGGRGDDTVAGGDGYDVFVLSGDQADYQIVDLGGGLVQVTDNAGLDGVDLISGFEEIRFVDGSTTAPGVLVGTAGADTLTGTSGNDAIYGLDGADSLAGGDGDDTLIGGLGNDVLKGGAGDDLIDASLGTDTADGGAGIDTLSFAQSLDRVFFTIGNPGFSNIENILGSGFDDVLNGDAGANLIDGGAGDDMLAGGKGNNTIIGGEGEDKSFFYALSEYDITRNPDGSFTLVGHGEVDLVVGVEVLSFAGVDFSADMVPTSGNDIIVGTDDGDIMQGGAGDDLLDGGLGDDLFLNEAGNDTFSGGDGDDTLQLNERYADCVLTRNADGSIVVSGEQGVDVLVGIETLWFTDVTYSADRLATSSADTIIGGGDNDMLVGLGGDDSLAGLGGDDTLEGDIGADTLDGGLGLDRVTYAESAGAVQVDLSGATPMTGGDAAGDVLIGIEVVIGTDFGDLLLGDGEHNGLYGQDGDDTLAGGLGDDVLDGGYGMDTADYSQASGGMFIDLTTKFRGIIVGTATGPDGTDSLYSIESVVGTGFGDTIISYLPGGTLDGGDGDDSLAGPSVLLGGAGDDILMPGALNRMDGGDGEDTISFARFDHAATFDMQAGRLGGKVIKLMSVEDIAGSSLGDVLAGDSHANRIDGGDGSDNLDGRAGNDVLTGGLGADTMTGGSGADAFVFRSLQDSATSAMDIIVDLETADTLDLSAIDADVAVTGDQAFILVSAFDHHAGELVLTYRSAKGDTLMQLDVDGDAVADMTVSLAGDQRGFTGFVL